MIGIKTKTELKPQSHHKKRSRRDRGDFRDYCTIIKQGKITVYPDISIKVLNKFCH